MCLEPLVSIIIPAYNEEKVVKDCISSIKTQTYNNLEIIIVDDGSVDNTCYIIEELTKYDQRIRIIKQKNHGASSARNRGIQEANGTFIMFVDADDVIMENMVEVLVKKQKELNADLVQSAILYISDKKHEQVLSDTRVHKYKSKEEINKHFFEILDNDLNSPVGKLYKKDIIDKNNIFFDEKLEVSEDLCFNLYYLDRIERMVYIPDVLYKYYLYNSFLTKKYKNNLFNMRKMAIVVLDEFLIRNGLERDKIYYLYIKLVFASAMQEIEHKKGRKERYKEIDKNLKCNEVKESILKCNPQGRLERALYYIIRTNSRKLIDLMSYLMVFIRRSKLINFKRISV